jgi:hypothetical protein
MTRLLLFTLLLTGCAPTPRPAQDGVPPAVTGGFSPTPWAGRAAGTSESGHPGAPTARPTPGRITPSPTVTGSSPEPTRTPRTASILRGIATWFRSPSGVAAAGPQLREALGPGWRGTHVRVCRTGRCVQVVLGDWCGCGGGRIIDLDDQAFAALAPLSLGVVKVRVSW